MEKDRIYLGKALLTKKNIFFLGIFLLTFCFPLSAFDHNHTKWDGLLKKHVSAGLVSYKGFNKDKLELQSYLEALSEVTESEYSKFSKEQKLSFLINAYNAFTVQLILDHYPLTSIRKIGIFPGAAWRKEFFNLLGKKRNLDWIEHSKLRIDFEEPRIHFAIVCASIGCPVLISESYTPGKLNTQLQTVMNGFLQDKSRNYFDSSKQILYLSSIFNWFQKDFTKKGSLVDFVNGSMNQEIPSGVKIEYLDYNWNLNERK